MLFHSHRRFPGGKHYRDNIIYIVDDKRMVVIYRRSSFATMARTQNTRPTENSYRSNENLALTVTLFIYIYIMKNHITWYIQ